MLPCLTPTRTHPKKIFVNRNRQNNIPSPAYSISGSVENPIVNAYEKRRNYNVKEKLGEGAFSVVYRAYAWKHDLNVALKRINLVKIDPKYMAMCFKEVELLKSINSPHVVKFLDSYPDNNNQTLCLILELMDDGDMYGAIERCRSHGIIFTELTIWHYFHQICSGLAALHNKRILHRDIKPANIFMRKDGHVKLGDLGLSRAFSEKTILAKTRVGTEYYLSPERNQQNGYSFKSDIWSLGCLLYEMCNFRSPFNGELSNVHALHTKIFETKVPPFAAKIYSKFIHYFISSCMSVDPNDRPVASECFEAAERMHVIFQKRYMAMHGN